MKPKPDQFYMNVVLVLLMCMTLILPPPPQTKVVIPQNYEIIEELGISKPVVRPLPPVPTPPLPPAPVVVVPTPKPTPVVPAPKPSVKTFKGLVSVDNMYNSIVEIASVDDARVAGTMGESQALDHMRYKLEGYGYNYQYQVFDTFLKNPDGSQGVAVQSRNLIATTPNFDSSKKSIVLIAHIDSVYTAGANDNASGSAMVVELARYLITRTDLKYNIVILLTGAEEGRHAGAKYYVAHPIIPLSSTYLALNFDMVGAGSAYQIFNYRQSMQDAYYSRFALNIGKRMGLNIVKTLTPYSDHKEFEEKGVQAVTFMNLKAYPYYHKDSDTPSRISKTTLRNISDMALNVIEEANKR